MYRKRIIATFLLVLFTVAALYAAEGFYTLNLKGDRVEPGLPFTNQDSWQLVGNFLAAGDEPTTPTGANRGYDVIQAAENKFISYTIPSYWNSVILRYTGRAVENQVNVTDMFLMRGATDSYIRIATITWTTGAQETYSDTYLLADTAVISNEAWLVPINVLSKANDYCAYVELDVRGFKKIGFIPTTLASDGRIEITGY